MQYLWQFSSMELKSEDADDSGLLGNDAVSLGEYEGTTFLRNVGNHSHHDTASHAIRQEFSVTSLWAPSTLLSAQNIRPFEHKCHRLLDDATHTADSIWPAAMREEQNLVYGIIVNLQQHVAISRELGLDGQKTASGVTCQSAQLLAALLSAKPWRCTTEPGGSRTVTLIMTLEANLNLWCHPTPATQVGEVLGKSMLLISHLISF
jgi:hypothetical protein